MPRKQNLLQTLTLVSRPTYKLPSLCSFKYVHLSNIELGKGDVIVFRIASAYSGDSVNASRMGIGTDSDRVAPPITPTKKGRITGPVGRSLDHASITGRAVIAQSKR